MEDNSVTQTNDTAEQAGETKAGFNPLSIVASVGEHPLFIALVYGAMLYLLPPYGWLVMVAVMGSVFAHEAGHLIAAKLNGAPVTVFSVGLPSKWTLNLGTYGGTRFQITPYWFVGGYVDPDMRGLAFWRMSTIMLAGVMVNLALSFMLFASAYISTGVIDIVGERAVVTELFSEIPNAKIAGLRVGDEIVRVDGVFVADRTKVNQMLQTRKGQLTQLQVSRSGHYENIPVLVNESAHIGITMGGTIERPPSFSETVGMAATQTVKAITRTGSKLLELSHLVEPESKDPDRNRMHGIVAVVEVGTAALSHGLGYFLFVIASVNASLFFVNLVPLPVLDGGQIVMLGIQKFRDRRFNPKLEGFLVQACIWFFIGLMVLSFYNDIVHRVKF